MQKSFKRGSIWEQIQMSSFHFRMAKIYTLVQNMSTKPNHQKQILEESKCQCIWKKFAEKTVLLSLLMIAFFYRPLRVEPLSQL